MENTWQKDFEPNKIYPKLSGNIEAEVAIVGGGITGITLAYLLAKEGKKVVVLEKGTLESSSYTAYTTAMLTAQTDTGFADLVDMWGKDKAVKIWQSGIEALGLIEDNVVKEKISCDFMRVPLYVYANDKKEWERIEKDGELAKSSGFNISFHDQGFQLGVPNLGYYVFMDQAKFHPLKYCDGLRQAAENLGAQFYENTEVVEIEGKDPFFVKTNDGKKVIAKWVAVATYEPFNKPKELFAKKGMYTTYMLQLSMEKGKMREGLYVDYYSPYHYFRVDAGKERDYVLLGGADHRREIKIDPEKNYKDLEEYADKIFGHGGYKIENKWSGGILEPSDGLPLIGSYDKGKPNLLVATAYSGNGITYSQTAARILKDLILGQVNQYAEIFDPQRNMSIRNLAKKGKDFTSVLIHGAGKNIFRHK